MPTFDLSALDTSKAAEQGAKLQLKSPGAGEPLPITLTVLGTDSEVYAAAVRAQARKQSERFARNRRTRITAEELEADRLDLSISLVVGWTPFNVDGVEWIFTPARCRELLTRFPWVREQVEEFAAERINFLPESAPN